MSLATCAKCEALFSAPDDLAAGAPRVCQRCLAIAELLAAADALNTRVRDELDRSHRNLLVAVVHRADLVPLIDRASRAIEKARAL